ncbi:hypothetical protein B0H13DRAFT_2331468 [Mycena leptocephala]|nr:hypothetical protein B0H13DRAFT_2331468 [Mycena leptocephala]
MLTVVILLFSLLLASPSAVARPSPTTLGTSLLFNRQGQDTGIGPIPPGCEAACNPLVPVFADQSIDDPTVVCASGVRGQVEACYSCEAGVLIGSDKATIQDVLSNLEAVARIWRRMAAAVSPRVQACSVLFSWGWDS